MNYNGYVMEYINKYPLGEPIYIENLKEDLKKVFKNMNNTIFLHVNVILNRLIKTGVIKTFYKGIYYKPETNIFGEVLLDAYKVVEHKYLKDSNGDIKGYIYGAKLFNILGFTTQVPNILDIVTNECKNNNIYTNTNLNVTIRKPKIEITNDNYLYLQLLDILENRDKINIEVDNANEIVYHYIKSLNLDYKKILYYAKITNNMKAIQKLMEYTEV
ncbi:MAG: hypothetical protein RR144_04835 [Clostridia bacterium]